MTQFNLPLRAVPRAELELNGSRVIEDSKGDEVAYVPFDEHAEEFAKAVNGYDKLRRCLITLIDDLEDMGFDRNDPISGADLVDAIDGHYQRIRTILRRTA